MGLSARPKQVRTLIVNGEAAMRAQLHRLCEDRPDLDVIAEATSGAQAIDVIQGSDADLLLLDARLPDMSGFELLRSLVPEAAPATIMVSSRDEAGRQPSGINVNFLYKPVDPPQFNAAVDSAIPIGCERANRRASGHRKSSAKSRAGSISSTPTKSSTWPPRATMSSRTWAPTSSWPARR